MSRLLKIGSSCGSVKYFYMGAEVRLTNTRIVNIGKVITEIIIWVINTYTNCVYMFIKHTAHYINQSTDCNYLRCKSSKITSFVKMFVEIKKII